MIQRKVFSLRKSKYPIWNGIPRFEKYVPSEIDFYPCFVKPEVGPFYDGVCNQEGGYVQVLCLQLLTGEWRVAIWGADDYGFERDLEGMEEALALYNSIQWVDRIPDDMEVC